MQPAAASDLSRSEEDRAFLQRRVALFGLIIGGGYLFFLAYRSVVLLAMGRTSGFFHPTFWWHLAAGAAFASLWLVCRRGKRSFRFIHGVELVALTLGVLATGAMALNIPLESRPDFVMLLALSNVVLGRAILVPSSGRWTATIGVVVGAVLLACVYVGSVGLDVGRWSAIYPELTLRSPQGVAAGVTWEIGVWWTLAIMLSTATSVVIYGLRRRVRDAEQLGQYRLEEKVGEGGMGTVYRASHAFLRRPTAVKLLPPERAGAENIRRFEQEVQLTAQLRHPNTITIFDYGHTADGLFYYAMEYVDGLTLSDLVSRTGPLPAGRVVHLMRQAASALAEAHGVGLVHRDIKPGNIMVHLLHPHGAEGDFVKVLDFGLVKEVGGEAGIELTNASNLAGTPLYMAPESLTSPEAVDGRADLYALGCVTYYLLTGTHVFGGDNIVEVCGHHLHTTPEPPSSRLGRSISADLEDLVMCCLRKDPAERPSNALELEQRLLGCADVPAWTHEDAKAWWAAHGQRAPGAARSPDGPSRTIDVELSYRDDPDRS
jgi:serine/threonine-protein kinase